MLPLVVVRVNKDGLLDITVDREPHDTDGPLTRDALHRLLNTIADNLASPLKVEIHELDEPVFTDFITLEPKRAVQPPRPVRSSISTSTGEVSGDGFLPDEEVAVAVVVAHQVANADGIARLRLPPALLAGRSGLVVLVGQSSGKIAVSGGTA
ncbi:hypothetical protein [Nocardioides psychrotolerans]|uniref:hypothetical protein n=1 Tax=Nocardioides psychrotolerans TaxID=1005945 RepID=UPI000B824E1C|nr:hypothetical protein [Nocardioides psychrotolerans]